MGCINNLTAHRLHGLWWRSHGRTTSSRRRRKRLGVRLKRLLIGDPKPTRVVWRWGKFFLRAKPTKCLIISPIRVAILWGIRHIGHMVRLYYPFLLECYGVESALQCRGSLYKGPADLAGHQNEQVDFPKMPSGVSKWGLRQVMAVWLRTYGYTGADSGVPKYETTPSLHQIIPQYDCGSKIQDMFARHCKMPCFIFSSSLQFSKKNIARSTY